jgi:hypothetical protein
VCSQTLVRPGTSDCPVVHRTVSGALGWSAVNSPLSRFDGGVRLKFTGPSGGAPDCPVSHPRRTRRSREKDLRRTAKIHRTVRWCTGLSGEPTVASASGRPRNLRATFGSSNGQLVHRTVQCANGPGGATVNCARFERKSSTGQATVAVQWRTGLSGAPLDRRQGWPSKLVFNSS